MSSLVEVLLPGLVNLAGRSKNPTTQESPSLRIPVGIIELILLLLHFIDTYQTIIMVKEIKLKAFTETNFLWASKGFALVGSRPQ